MNTDHAPAATPSTAPNAPRSAATRLVVGCGYLGTRVARRWLAAGDRVFGITRSQARGPVAATNPRWVMGCR